MKKYKITFWITTTIVFIMEGVLVALTSHTDMSVNGITSLGYPLYFVPMLAVFKILGSIALMVPKVPARIKEWAYAGFGIDFIAAFVSLWYVTGVSGILIMPIAFMIILALSYVSYQKIAQPFRV